MSVGTAPGTDADREFDSIPVGGSRGPGDTGGEGDSARGRAHLDATLAAWIAIVALAVGLIASPPWSGTSADLPAGVVARFESGTLERLDASSWVAMQPGDLVQPGTELRSEDGAVLQIRFGRIELAHGSRVTADRTLRIEAGGVLVDSRDDEQRVAVGPVVATGRGVWRVDARSVRRVAVYDGQVRAGSAGEGGLAIGVLAQADLAGGQLPGRALPLRYEESDDWDGRLLEHVIAVDRQAAGLRRSLDVRFGTEDRPAGFYEDVAGIDAELRGALDVLDRSPDGGFGPSPEVLLAITAVRAIREATGMSATSAAEDVAAMRRDGATWGIVLGRHGLRAEAFRVTFNETLSAAALGPPVSDADAEETTAGEVATDDEPQVVESPGAPEPPPPSDERPDEPPQTPPPPQDDPPDVCEVEPCEPVDDTIDDITDLLDEPLPEPTDGVLDSVDDAVGEVLPPVDVRRGPGASPRTSSG